MSTSEPGGQAPNATRPPSPDGDPAPKTEAKEPEQAPAPTPPVPRRPTEVMWADFTPAERGCLAVGCLIVLSVIAGFLIARFFPFAPVW